MDPVLTERYKPPTEWERLGISEDAYREMIRAVTQRVRAQNREILDRLAGK